MAEPLIRVQTYVVVCVLLVLLTVLTVGLSFWHVPPVWHIVLGLCIAVCKASLVVLFFMHALISTRLTWIVILVSCFWLGILLVLTLGDYFSRGMVPAAPGH
ncbi:MAG TPA: cytochrome C oxidase subunit IV family protein [Gemmataceae bacterium]|nr:cytochrome C oxidase subunit IV family protein [Gemmataceae bacterium]